ncbi:MAG: hypothetical protein A2X32_09890 [Elusimicrobia bacterium GWC2_64_44]|nr:MAG: hypothetical protein A2X32_09890 [Elusimicrobia bacterium GWC2_64_44]
MTPPLTLTLRLKKPLARGITSLKLLDPTISDLAGLLTGVKPVTYTDYAGSDWPYIKGLCDALGLVYADPEAAAARRGKHLGSAPGGRKMLLLARKPGPLKAAVAAWGKSAIDRDWGMLLGYPACCVDAYIRWRTGCHEQKDLVRFTAENSPAGKAWDFKLNNIVNYFSRVYGADEPQSRLISDLNQRAGLLISIAHVASWHSCSYLCKESSKKASAIFEFFEDYAPAYAAGLKRLLARPFLFVDKYDFLPLEKKAGAGWAFTYPALPLGLLPPGRAAALKNSDGLEISGRGLKLGGRTLKTPAAPLILNFSSRNL